MLSTILSRNLILSMRSSIVIAGKKISKRPIASVYQHPYTVMFFGSFTLLKYSKVQVNRFLPAV